MFELRLFLADCNIAPGGRTLRCKHAAAGAPLRARRPQWPRRAPRAQALRLPRPYCCA